MKKLTILFSSMAMLFGVGLGVGAAVKGEAKVEKAEAAVTMQTLFLDCSSVGGWDSESICIGTWNGKVNTYTEATKKADNYWQVTIDIDGLQGVEFYRCESGNTGTRWNKSSWNTNPSTNNYCKITAFDESSTWSSVNSSYKETYEVANTSPSSSTKRIWVDPKDKFYDADARAALRTFSGTTHHKTYILGGSSQYKTVSGQTLFYVDIPVGDDCQLVRLHNAFNFVWTYGGNFSEISGYNTANVVYSWAADAGYSAANEGSPTVDYAKAVLDGYSTCLASSANGYGNYSNIKSGVLDKLSAANLSSLRNATFSDPTYGTRTYGAKIDLMADQSASLSSNIRPLTLGDETATNATLATVIITVVSLAAVGGFFFLRKKKLSK